MEFIPPQFSPHHPPPHLQPPLPPHMQYNQHHHMNTDMNNNSMHMYNHQPSLLLATPLNAPPLVHSSASSEAGPADSESSTSPTDSGGESTLSSDDSGSSSNFATATSPDFINGGSQFYQQNGMMAQMTEDCQKMNTQMGNNQYVSLFIV